MPTTRPGFIWSGTEWVAIGQEAVVNPFYYQATAPTGAATGAIWIESDVDVPSIDSAQFLRWRKTMTGGETSLSGNDDSSLPLAYTPGYEQLYINGVLQVRGQDYTATTGTTVTGLTALVANDVVEIFSAVARTVADVYTQTQSDARFVNRNVGGLNLVVPTSVTGGTVSANGAVTVGSAVSSVVVSGAFSSTYENYLITYSGGAGSNTGAGIYIRFNNSTGSTYNHYGNYGVYGSATLTATQSASTSAGVLVALNHTVAKSLNCEVVVRNPFDTSVTTCSARTAGAVYTMQTQGYDSNSASQTGFLLAVDSATMTGGTIRIYGYNNGA
jgi:hypothetical protein